MEKTEKRELGIIMNGVTGRMGTNQHLKRSILPIIQEGGLPVSNQETLLPDPVLVGRNPAKLQALAAETGVKKWTTELDRALADSGNQIYFDCQTTPLRARDMKKAIAAGKHVYCEKPSAQNTQDAWDLYRRAERAGVKHGVVQDKLFLPGFIRLKKLLEGGFFGRVLSVRVEFGYWVFEGDRVEPQRPSWNYRREEGGGIILDMFPHWRYLLDNLFGRIKSVFCIAITHIPERWDESGQPYRCSAEDAAYASFQLEGDIIATVNASWAVRVRRDDLLTVQVDGTEGSAVATLRDCLIQPYSATPRPVWNPDLESPADYRAEWLRVPDQQSFGNAFRTQWEKFLRHVVQEEPFPWDLCEGAKGVQLAEKALESWKTGKSVAVPELET